MLPVLDAPPRRMRRFVTPCSPPSTQQPASVRGSTYPMCSASSWERNDRFRQQYAYVPENDPCFTPGEGTLSISFPVQTMVTITHDNALRLGSLDGTRSVEALWHAYHETGIIPADVPLEASLASLVPLFVTGVLETKLLPLPPLPLPEAKPAGSLG